MRLADGVVNFLKPPAMSSHQAVNAIRRVFAQRRVGHAGTLDPFAAGVLPICVGRATRLTEYLLTQDKCYLARVRLGVTTDTHDLTGQLQSQGDASRVDRQQVEVALERLSMQTQQVPPRHSAIQVQGRRSYQRARRGEEFSLAPRPVVIHQLCLHAFSPGRRGELLLEVCCGKGTYIRALARDVGELLGCGAVLTHLLRTCCGPFSLQDALTLEEVKDRGACALIPAAEALAHLPCLRVSWDERERISHGVAPVGREPAAAAPLRLIDPQGDLVAIGAWRGDRIKLLKVLV